MKRAIKHGLAGLMGLALSAQAQTLTWDTAPGTAGVGDGSITHTNGVWDGSTANWTTDGGANNQIWSSGADALFTTNPALSSIIIDVVNGTTVRNITLQDGSGTGEVTLRGQADNDVLNIAAGGASWELGGRRLNMSGDQSNDLAVNMNSGDTLTITSASAGSTFDAGEKPNGANWTVGGATLDFQGQTLRGANNNVGQFATVKMIGGSTFFHERNTGQTYANNWELGAGTVTFDNRFNRTYTFDGIVSGDGTLKVEKLNGNELSLRGNNTFTGGVIVDGADSQTTLNINNDNQLGDVSGDITLANGGILRANGVNISSTRDIVLDNGGVIVNDSNANSFAGKITGTGGLEIGSLDYAGLGNSLTLSSDTSDYTGETRVVRGTLQLGIDDALPSGSVLAIGGVNSSLVEMDGYDLTVAGLKTYSANTRRIDNNGAAESTLTIDVADGESYSYGANLAGSSAIHIIKDGAGTQEFNKSDYATAPASITVNDGVLVWNSGNGAATTVGAAGTLGGSGTFDGAVNVAGSLAPGNSPGTMTFNDGLTLESTATLTLELTGTAVGAFDVLANDGGDTLTAGGALVFDATGYSPTLGDSFTVFTNWGVFAGSFSSVSGTDLGGGLSLDTGNLLTDGTVTVIPEPATLGLVLGLGGGLFWFRRIFKS